MAIPAGTTARQLEAIARWTFAGVVILGMLTWWWPGYRAWGALSAGMLFILTLWLIWRTVQADRTVPGHPMHLALLAPAILLVWHVARTGFSRPAADAPGLLGAVNLSMLFHLALLAAGILLTQSLLPRAASHAAVLSACGAAMMGSAAVAMAWGQEEIQAIRSALGLLAFSGVAVWLSPLWGISAGPAWQPHPLRRRELRFGCIVVGLAATGALAAASPFAALIAAGVTAAVLILGGLTFPPLRRRLLAIGAVLAVVTAVVLIGLKPLLPDLVSVRTGWLGRGEAAFDQVSAGDSGLVVLAGTIGWLGVGWLAGGLALCILGLFLRARHGDIVEQSRAIGWTTATALASAALLMPGGLFVPSVTLAAAMTWGLLPLMVGRRPRNRPGLLLLLALGVLLGLIGLVRVEGLPAWAALSFGADKNFLHGPAGFILAMVVAWLIGSRRGWLGLTGIVLVALAGGLGELGQHALAPWRGAEMQDWLYHSIGCALAAIPYSLAMGSRWAETADRAEEGFARASRP